MATRKVGWGIGLLLFLGCLLDDGEAFVPCCQPLISAARRTKLLHSTASITAEKYTIQYASSDSDSLEVSPTAGEIDDDDHEVQPPISPLTSLVSEDAQLTALEPIPVVDIDTLAVTTPSQQQQPRRSNSSSNELNRVRSEAYLLFQAAIIGVLVGAAVALFKFSIEEMRQVAYGFDFAYVFLPLIPALGGLVVGLLMLPGSFPPGLKGSIREIDNDARRTVSGMLRARRHPFGFLRKTAASVATLGTGSSLGPEGPSVEVGISMSRICMNFFPPVEYLFPNDSNNNNPNQKISNVNETLVIQRNRLLLSCGAAAGVSAGFNAPIAGVFFALEIVEGALAEVERTGSAVHIDATRGPLGITAVLVASVLAALVFRSILGNEMVLSVASYNLQTPLNELPLYLLLGTMCGVVAFVFSQTAKVAKSMFDGDIGPQGIRDLVKSLPYSSKPMIGGLLCGLIAIPYPQILFFGYETLNALLNSLLDDSLPFILSLLFVKTIATALAAGSGLVGGTFAPSLFLGAMTGAGFHQIMDMVVAMEMPPELAFLNHWEIADGPAYAMVGAASVLAALFRAPLTASLLLFELTRDYDVILPLMVSAGIASVASDIIESLVEQEEVEELRRDRDSVSWGDLADKKEVRD